MWYPCVPYGDLPAAHRVYVAGMPTGAAVEPWCAGADAEVYRDGHYPVIRDSGGPDGTPRTIMAAEQWWGGDTVDSVLAARAWSWTENQIQALWRDPRVILLATPGTTGRDLWARTPAAEGCPIMGPASQQIVRETASQGRIETFPARAELLPMMWEYDLRLAYAAVLRGLPVGEPHLVERPTVAEVCEHRSRALVTFNPPAGWDRIGIIGTRTGDGIEYPARPTPGGHGPTWADGCEIELAHRYGWSITVHTALIWPTTGEPLREWSGRLLSVLRRADDTLSPRGARAVRQIVRAIILHTVGAFHGAPHRVTCRAIRLEDAPIGATMLRAHDDGSVTWQEQRPAAWPDTVHPEWSSHIWARARRRLLTGPPGSSGALALNPRTIVAIRTDAIYTTIDTGWQDADTGKPGAWVLKRTIDGPIPWPRTGLDVVAAREGVR